MHPDANSPGERQRSQTTLMLDKAKTEISLHFADATRGHEKTNAMQTCAQG
jgi:hypothetical protein